MSIFKKISLTIIPLIIFLAIIMILWRGLALHPNQVPSPLVNKSMPELELPDLFNQNKLISKQNFIGHITLLNVWASWCYSCAEEHDLLLDLANKEHLTIYGFNYKDDKIAAKKWLDQHGNPYQRVMMDNNGSAAIDWGVYGTPETFVIDKKGIIRYKQIGPITNEDWETILKPLIQQLQST